MSRPDAPDLADRIAGLSAANREVLRSKLGQQQDAIDRRPERDTAPLSFAQQRLYFLDRLEPRDSLYNAPRAIRLRGRLDTPALAKALSELVRRHEVLRSRFVEEGGELVSRVDPAKDSSLPVVDLEAVPEPARETEATRLAREEAVRPFDLSRGPVLRSLLLRLAPEEHILLLTTHHIVSDAWSAAVLFQELGALYSAFAAGEPSPLPELPIQYGDFARWQRDWLSGDALEKQLSYWKDRLRGAPALLEVPSDHVRPSIQSFRGATKTIRLSGEPARQLRELARSEGVTLFMVLLAAFQALLYRYTGCEDIVVGTPIANRNRPEIEGLIGFFVNTLVLRTDLSGDPTFREVLGRVREVSLGAYGHQDLPFEKLVEELQPGRDLSRHPLFQVLIALRNTPPRLLDLSGLDVEFFSLGGETAKFDLSLYVDEKVDGLTCTAEYSTDLFEASTIERFLSHFEVLLAGAAADPGERIRRLPLLTESERETLLVEWNDTAASYSSGRCIHELFEEQVDRAPEAPALFEAGRRVSYRELNRRANRLAAELRERGVGPNVPVAVSLERSAGAVVALLGVLKSGGAYVPLDPAFPEARVRFMLRDSGARVVVADESGAGGLAGGDVRTVRLADSPAPGAEWDANPSSGARLGDLAYVIYTSGSTGEPKGVLAPHRGAINRFAWMWRTYPFEEGEVCCQKTALSFVDSVWEIFGPLLAGVASVVLPPRDVLDPETLLDALAAARVTRIVLVPSLLRNLLDASRGDLAGRLPHLKFWVVSGEALPLDVYRRFRTLLPRAVLLNLYGSSEVAADVTCYEARGPGPERSVPIGRPIANTRIYVLDALSQPVPIGVAGELYVGGDGLARGYHNRPELTAERFLPDPFAGDPAARLFRTGDVARYLSDGNLEYLGRRDHQVKIRGQRIELGEIEAALAAEPEVEAAAVVIRETPAGDPLLVAYVVPRPGSAISEGGLRSRLERKLPQVMVPSAIRRLEAFPLTPSGKIDRQALPAFDGSRPEMDSEFVEPRTPTERTVAAVWAQVLGLTRVGAEDDFFALGGHSLLVIRVMSRLREALGADLPVRAFFEAPTVAALSRRFELGQSVETPQRPWPAPLSSPASPGAPVPLSFAQQRLWVLDQVEPGSTAYLIRRAFRLLGRLDAATLRRAIDAVVARHEILRTRFVVSDGVARQVVDAAGAADFREIDATATLEGSRDADAAHWASQPEQPFDLTRGPMLRATLVRLAADDHLLLVTIHHIASDAWSIGILLREISVSYEALAAGRLSSLTELPIQYADFAVWQRNWLSGEILTAQLSYWREQLRGAPERIELATDRPRPRERSGAGARRFLRLSADLTRDLQNLGRGERATPYMTLLAGFALLLSRYTRQDDILIGSPIAGRNRDETEGLIGLFLNTLVLRARLSGDPSFTELIRRVRETVIHAFVHQDLPFEKLVDELRPARSLSHNPLFQVWFVLQNAPASPLEISGVEARPVSLPGGDARHELQLTLWQTGEGLAGSIDYSTDLFDASTIDTMAERLEILLRLAADSPELPLSALGRALDQAEARRADANEKRIEETSRRSLKTAKRKGIRV